MFGEILNMLTNFESVNVVSKNIETFWNIFPKEFWKFSKVKYRNFNAYEKNSLDSKGEVELRHVECKKKKKLHRMKNRNRKK